MSDKYEYEIDEKAKALAENELGENPPQVNAHIESLRRWVTSMPHIQCPTDADFLLKFLRASKFDHAKAQRRIDNFCTVRTSERGFPDIFKIRSIRDPTFETYLKMKVMTCLGKVDSGETVFLIRITNWDPDVLPMADLISWNFMMLDLIVLSEEDSQIFGIKILFDFVGVNKKIIESLSDPKMVKTAYVALQDSYPIRFKGQIFCSDSLLFDVLFQMVEFFLNEKLKRRTFRLRHDISKLIQKIPGLEKILPKEYHGLGGTLDEYFERWNAKCRSFFKDGHPLHFIHVDESKRPKDTLHFLATHKDFKSEFVQHEGTYTKYENIL